MAKAWCVTKPNGLALISFPSGPKDSISFNINKTYGPLMTSHVFANWQLVYTNLDYSMYLDECPFCYEAFYVLKRVVNEEI